MRFTPFLALLAFTFVSVPSPGAQPAVDAVTFEKIRREGLDNSQAYATFSHLVNVVGPRLTATPEYKVAADWARDRLAGWGLRDARLESWEFGRGWTLDKFTLEMTAPRYMPLMGYPEAWSASMDREIEGTPLFIGDKSLDELESMADRLRGAILLTQPIQTTFVREDRAQPTADNYAPPAPRGQDAAGRGRGRGRGANAERGETPAQRRARILREARPAAVLRTSRGEHGTMFVLGRDAGENALPTVIVAAEHYNMLVRSLNAGTPVKLRVDLQSRYLTADRNGYNVLAELPGSDPVLKDEVVMIGAHLDSYHTAPGATDNADGSAVALEAMRILSAIGARPRRTIRVALWGGEEQGLLGSAEYVRRHLAGDANAAARERFSVYFNIDPGTGPIYGWFLQGQENVRPMMDAWLAPLRDLGARRNVSENIGNTDHLSFTRIGLPGFNPVQDYVDYDVRTHHTNVDSFERVREEDLKQGAIVLASFAYHAAMMEEKFPRPPVRE
jgi:carboxypeptidase Q